MPAGKNAGAHEPGPVGPRLLGPRDRLLGSARTLTYEQGVGVGTDSILRDADVARASLYQHFGSKDGLIAEVLRGAARDDLDAVRGAMNSTSGGPEDRILAVFDALQSRVEDPAFRGCRYAAAEMALIGSADHPAHLETKGYVEALEQLFIDELEQASHPDPRGASDQLVILVEGVLAAAMLRPGVPHSARAKHLAAAIVSGAVSSHGS